MAASTTPIYPLTAAIGSGKVLTANTNLDGTGTIVSILASGANGTRLDYVQAVHLGTNVATVLRLFLYTGSTYAIYKEATIAANAINQTAASVAVTIPCGDFIPAGYTLYASVGTTIAAGVMVSAFSGAY